MSESDKIVSKDEIIRILKNGETSNAEVSSNPPSVELQIVAASGTRLILSLKHKVGDPAPALATAGAFSRGEPIEVIFSLVDGQYAVRAEIRDVTPTTFTVDASEEMLRLQRRKDFRVAIARGSMRFILHGPAITGATATATSLSFDLIDLSAGGLRLLWPPEAGAIPRVGERLGGDLVLKVGPPAESLALTLSFVKDHGADAPLKPELGDGLSFRFESLSQEDARAVLFACLGVYRSSYGSR